MWALDQVLKMNLDKARRGVPLNEEWHPLAVAESHKEALDKLREVKREIRARRMALEAGAGEGRPGVAYPAGEKRLDEDCDGEGQCGSGGPR